MKLIFEKPGTTAPAVVEFDLIHSGKVDYEKDGVVIWNGEICAMVETTFDCPAVPGGVVIPLGNESCTAVVELDDPLADKDMLGNLRCIETELTPAEEAWIVEYW